MLRIFSLLVLITGIFLSVFALFPELKSKLFPGHFQMEIAQEAQRGDLTFEEFYRQGQSFAAQGFFTLAVNNFSQAATLQPARKDVRLDLVQAQIAMQDFQSARNVCENSLQVFQGDSDFLVLLGEIFLQMSDFANAKKTFARLSDGSAKNFHMAIVEILEGDFTLAKSLAKAAAKDEIRAKKIVQAFEEFALFPNGNQLHLQLLLAKSLDQIGFFAVTIDMCKKILQKNKNYLDAHLVLAHGYSSLKKFHFAKNILEKALELDPTKGETSFLIAEVEADLGDFPSAIAAMKNAVANGFEPRIEAEKKIADFHLQAGDHGKAAEEFEKILQKEHGEVGNFVQLVWVLLEFAGDSKKAISVANWAVQAHGDLADSHNILGWAQLESGDFNNAKKSLSKALQIDPNFAAAHLNFGKIFQLQGNFAKAAESFAKAQELAPRSEIGRQAAQKFAEVANEL